MTFLLLLSSNIGRAPFLSLPDYGDPPLHDKTLHSMLPFAAIHAPIDSLFISVPSLLDFPSLICDMNVFSNIAPSQYQSPVLVFSAG
jgi:hypothetical protein